jgi:hypothetical protein
MPDRAGDRSAGALPRSSPILPSTRHSDELASGDDEDERAVQRAVERFVLQAEQAHIDRVVAGALEPFGLDARRSA